MLLRRRNSSRASLIFRIDAVRRLSPFGLFDKPLPLLFSGVGCEKCAERNANLFPDRKHYVAGNSPAFVVLSLVFSAECGVGGAGDGADCKRIYFILAQGHRKKFNAENSPLDLPEQLPV